MLQALMNAIFTFVVTYVIAFVVLIVLFRVCIGKIMKLLGADFYTFNMKKRLTTIGIISLVFAVICAGAALLG